MVFFFLLLEQTRYMPLICISYIKKEVVVANVCSWFSIKKNVNKEQRIDRGDAGDDRENFECEAYLTSHQLAATGQSIA